MKDKGVVDALVSVSRQLTTLGREKRGKLFRCYIDLMKAYDRANRQLLWELLSRYGVPVTIVSVIQSFHEGAQARVEINGGLLRRLTYQANGQCQELARQDSFSLSHS